MDAFDKDRAWGDTAELLASALHGGPGPEMGRTQNTHYPNLKIWVVAVLHGTAKSRLCSMSGFRRLPSRHQCNCNAWNLSEYASRVCLGVDRGVGASGTCWCKHGVEIVLKVTTTPLTKTFDFDGNGHWGDPLLMKRWV